MEEVVDVKVVSGSHIVPAVIQTSPLIVGNRNVQVSMENVINIKSEHLHDNDTVRKKSSREKKTPFHLVNSIVDMNAVGETIQKRICESNIINMVPETPILKNKTVTKQKSSPRINNNYPNFKCDHCGSRYIVNPLRRGSKVTSPRSRATPRHKICPDTQKVLTLCNACGLKFSRPTKMKQNKEAMTEEDQKRFFEEGKQFAIELSQKLNNDAAVNLFCSNAKKSVCGCIQKYICGQDGSTVEEIIERAKDLLDISLQAIELKKKKCYPIEMLECKPGKKKALKIGLGNGHRKSKEFEDYVLAKRQFLRTTLKFCEKGTQKILSYSNNFLHKRMKTDPQKGIRIERQKGKAALGMLFPIEEIANQPCCVDNCVRMSLTHGRLLEVWRERATSSQIEARRVLAEMLTPSGGNRANCYKFVSLVTGCSHSTIGKVNEQMKSTGGDREPPEHGLKKYWKDKPKATNIDTLNETKFVPSYQILQTAANSAGLATMIEYIPETKSTEPAVKKMRRQPRKTAKDGVKKSKIVLPSATDGNLPNPVNIVAENGTHVAANLQNVQAVIAYPNGGYISIPTGLTPGNTITIPNGVSLHTMQQQVAQQQHQQQLQLQIEMLQQQLQNSQAGNLPQHTSIPSIVEDNPEYVVNVSNSIEQNGSVQSVGTPVVVEAVTTQDLNVVSHSSYAENAVTQSLVSNGTNSGIVLPTIASYSSENVSFVSSGESVNILHQNSETVQNHQNMPLLTSVTNGDDISIIPQTNATVNVITPQNTLAETSVIGVCATAPIESLRQVHLITSQSPTMALTQPVTLSLQTPSNLPTMLLTQSTSNEQRPSLPTMILTQSSSEDQRPATLQAPNISLSNLPTMLLTQSSRNEQRQTALQTPSISLSNLPTMLLTQSSSNEQRQATLQTPSISLSNLPTMLLAQSTSNEQRQPTLQTPSISLSNLPTMLLTQSTSNDQRQTLQTPSISLSNLPTMLLTRSTSNEQRQAAIQAPSMSLSNLPTMLLTQSTSNEQGQPTHAQKFIIQQTSASEQLVFQRPLFSQPNTEHIAVQQTIPTMHSSAEQTVAITSSALPPMSSFNADAFLTNNNATMKYTVLNTQSPSNTVMEEQSGQLDQTSATIQIPFLPS